jgi:hypothetical protein
MFTRIRCGLSAFPLAHGGEYFLGLAMRSGDGLAGMRKNAGLEKKEGLSGVAFENSLNTLRGSSNADVARAAAAYGAAGAANGVTVGFADLSKSGEDGKVISSLGVDANGNLQAQSNVTISTAASGAPYDAAVEHEGSHVADAQDVVKSIVVDPKTGDFTVGNNITRYQSEVRAYGVTSAILSSEGVNANEGCSGCDLGRNTMQGQVPGIVNRIMNVGNNYMSGGQHMGPKNQGGSVVNGVDQTPKAAVPHQATEENQMRNKLRVVGLLGVALMAVSALGQATPNAAAPAVPILQGAALPVYPPIAKAARVTGKVTVRVTVKDGLDPVH